MKWFKWVLFGVSFIIPLLLLFFVSFWSHQMRWEIGSPTLEGQNWTRWSHVYLWCGYVFSFLLYVPVGIAFLKDNVKLLWIPAVLVVVFFIVSFVVAFNGAIAQRNQNVQKSIEAVKIDPADSLALERLAESYKRSGQYGKAIEAYTNNLQLTDNPAFTYHDRGLVYMRMGELDRSIADINKGMELRPNDKAFIAQSYNDRAVAYFNKGNYQQSWEDVQKAQSMGYQKVHPDFLAALKSKGFNY